jgi:predicted nucleotidyltransferase
MELKNLLVDTCKVFDKLKIRYALIGGYAGILYNSPYTTADIDFVVVSESVSLRLVEELKKIDWIPTEEYNDPEELRAFGQFYQKDEGYPLHILPHVAGFSLEKKVRISIIDVNGYEIKVCSLEDLIVMRLAVWTQEDKMKAAALLIANNLDKRYLEKRAREEKVLSRLQWLQKEITKA